MILGWHRFLMPCGECPQMFLMTFSLSGSATACCSNHRLGSLLHQVMMQKSGLIGTSPCPMDSVVLPSLLLKKILSSSLKTSISTLFKTPTVALRIIGVCSILNCTLGWKFASKRVTTIFLIIFPICSALGQR